jgi:hypothetical protein
VEMLDVDYFLLLPVTYLAFLLTLLLSRSLFGTYKALSISRVLASALYLTVFGLAFTALAAYLLGSVIVAVGGSGKAMGLVHVVFIGVAAIGATSGGTWLAIRFTPCTARQRWHTSLTVALLTPLFIAGLLAGLNASTRFVQQQRARARYAPHRVLGAEAQALVARYGLPTVDSISYSEFYRDQPGEENYQGTMATNCNWRGGQTPWREWTEHLAQQAEQGLKAAGYSIERKAGYEQEVGQHWGGGKVADILIIGRRGPDYVRFIFTYQPTDGLTMPKCNLHFGAAEVIKKKVDKYSLDQNFIPRY